MSNTLQNTGATVAILAFILAFIFGITHFSQIVDFFDSHKTSGVDAASRTATIKEESQHESTQPTELHRNLPESNSKAGLEVDANNLKPVQKSQNHTSHIRGIFEDAMDSIDSDKEEYTTTLANQLKGYDNHFGETVQDLIKLHDAIEGGNVKFVEGTVEQLSNDIKPSVMCWLGSYYKELGEFEEALKWLRKALKAGCYKSALHLGHMYTMELGVEKDYRRAADFYREAALAGEGQAMYILALMYENGRGVEMDKKRAVTLYRKAAQLGEEKAAERLERITK